MAATGERFEFLDPRPLFADVPGGLLFNDETEMLNVRGPVVEYDPLPEIAGLHPSLEPLTREKVQTWWNSLLDDEVRVRCLRGTVLRDSWRSYRCDYCRQHVSDSCTEENPHWFCADCGKDMCPLCRWEVDEAVAEANGAKNYALRKESLQRCQRTHRLIKVRDHEWACDGCKAPIYQNTFYADFCDATGKRGPDWCPSCRERQPEPQQGWTRKVQTQPDVFTSFDVSEYGSMLDWLPVAAWPKEQTYFPTIFVNANPDAKFRGRVCFAQWDSHGRAGFWDAWNSWGDFLAWCRRDDASLRFPEPLDLSCENCRDPIEDVAFLKLLDANYDLCESCYEQVDEKDQYERYEVESREFPPGRFARHPLDFVLPWLNRSGYHG